MQIVSLGDNLHETSMAIFLDYKKKYFETLFDEIITQHAKR